MRPQGTPRESQGIGGSETLGGGLVHRCPGEGHLGRVLPNAPEHIGNRDKQYLNSLGLILLSRSNIDMLLFSIFILPPARSE